MSRTLFQQYKQVVNTLNHEQAYEFNLLLCKKFNVIPTDKNTYLVQPFAFWWESKIIYSELGEEKIFNEVLQEMQLKLNIQNTVNNIIDK